MVDSCSTWLSYMALLIHHLLFRNVLCYSLNFTVHGCRQPLLTSPLLPGTFRFPLRCIYKFRSICGRSPWKSVSVVRSSLLGGINLVSDSEPLQGLRLQPTEVLLLVSRAHSPGAKVSTEKGVRSPARKLAHTIWCLRGCQYMNMLIYTRVPLKHYGL